MGMRLRRFYTKWTSITKLIFFLLIGFLIWRTILNTDHSSTKVQMELLFEEPFLNPDLPPIKTEEWAEQLQSFLIESAIHLDLPTLASNIMDAMIQIAKRNQMRKIIFTWTSGDCEETKGFWGKLKEIAPKNQGKGGFQKLKNFSVTIQCNDGQKFHMR
ncbi:unnamed protein product, partial [Mesorhabditis belari]|uniref:Uncharacterized protein n=1 Tax=Mesorhabditis belari TaxID=2138241 RepID=A0AAF3JAT2_9BILA